MLIDASFGFEMETFEFLNICQVHGFPRIMGVLTHLDSFKNNKTLRKTKKNLKHRFWTEVYQVPSQFPRCLTEGTDVHRLLRLLMSDIRTMFISCETYRVQSCFTCLVWSTGSIRLRK